MLFKSSAYNRHSVEFNLTEFNSVNQIQLNQIKFVFNDKRLKQSQFRHGMNWGAAPWLSITERRILLNFCWCKVWQCWGSLFTQTEKKRVVTEAQTKIEMITPRTKHKSTVHSVLSNRQHISRTFPFLSSSCRALMTQSRPNHCWRKSLHRL